MPPIIADVSTFNHELAEWTNDPFINNAVPTWMFPTIPSDPIAVCGDNPSLEVGDPQGNGPNFADFPQANVPIDGVTYHLQQLVLWQWFTDMTSLERLRGLVHVPDTPGPHGSRRLLPVALGWDEKRRRLAFNIWPRFSPGTSKAAAPLSQKASRTGRLAGSSQPRHRRFRFRRVCARCCNEDDGHCCALMSTAAAAAP